MDTVPPPVLAAGLVPPPEFACGGALGGELGAQEANPIARAMAEVENAHWASVRDRNIKSLQLNKVYPFTLHRLRKGKVKQFRFADAIELARIFRFREHLSLQIASSASQPICPSPFDKPLPRILLDGSTADWSSRKLNGRIH